MRASKLGNESQKRPFWLISERIVRSAADVASKQYPEWLHPLTGPFRLFYWLSGTQGEPTNCYNAPVGPPC